MQNNIRPESMERITTIELANAFIEEQVKEVREQVGDKKVLLALSGGAELLDKLCRSLTCLCEHN